jgi:hypothetical protein
MATENTNLFHSKPLRYLPKIGIFGLKAYHLATLVSSKVSAEKIGPIRHRGERWSERELCVYFPLLAT